MATHERILIVDDDPSMRRTVERLLQSAGYEVQSIGSAEEARKSLQSSVYDVVVSDLLLPGTRGTELLHSVRQSGNSVPFIIMTGSPDMHSAVQAANDGVSRYILKPFRGQEMIDAVKAAARQGKRVDEGAGREVNSNATRFDAALSKLWMAYQPIVSAVSGKIEAYEALVRTDEKSVPHPGVLFDLAERLGRVCDVGRSVRQLSPQSLANGAPGALLFVNLHAAELADETLYDPNSPLAQMSDRVVLELTERATLGDLRETRAQLERLRALGFRIALDDLGAGYAGLTSLAALEPEVVKLDMSLVRNIDQSPVQRRLVEAMVLVARSARIQVVAEGIETAAERDTVRDLGCDWLQGYLFGRPVKLSPPAVAAVPQIAPAA
ncbi:MAG: EAL domain-containing protein [Deltaproteobacteria bacterium]|nr:EAL domain-containing protein [Deltaproteobacteria bacterium]